MADPAATLNDVPAPAPAPEPPPESDLIRAAKIHAAATIASASMDGKPNKWFPVRDAALDFLGKLFQ